MSSLEFLCQGDRSRYEFVQFHPSFTYEDFIEGQLPPGDFTDHLGREFNRRVYNLGFYSLLITPYDAGFRLIGVYDGAGPTAPTNALVYNSDYLVYNEDYLVYGA